MMWLFFVQSLIWNWFSDSLKHTKWVMCSWVTRIISACLFVEQSCLEAGILVVSAWLRLHEAATAKAEFTTALRSNETKLELQF